ncbi:MAG: DUF86 domain-containing protein [Coriobacteriia bacterium]|jgi:uncharacterized protein with HEPN domain
MRDPEANLADIAVYARRAVAYVDGMSLAEFARNTGVQDQVIRCLTVVGEAARRTPEGLRCRFPDVPWSVMIATRNRLAHEYDGIDIETVWLTVTGDLPGVLQQLEVYLPEA